jgi:hypothetical protein
LKTADGTNTVLFFIVIGAWVEVRLAVLEHEINNSGKLVSSGCHGFRAAMSGTDAAIKCPQSTIAASQALLSGKVNLDTKTSKNKVEGDANEKTIHTQKESPNRA